MIEHIKALLNGRTAATGEAKAEREMEALRQAVAALLIEAARMDGEFGDIERGRVRALLAERFSLGEDDVDALMAAARRMSEQAVDAYEFTHTISKNFDHEARIGIVEMLWDVAYADGSVHPYEANLLRRVAGLLYVTDQESGAARKRVAERNGA